MKPTMKRTDYRRGQKVQTRNGEVARVVDIKESLLGRRRDTYLVEFADGDEDFFEAHELKPVTKGRKG